MNLLTEKGLIHVLNLICEGPRPWCSQLILILQHQLPIWVLVLIPPVPLPIQFPVYGNWYSVLSKLSSHFISKKESIGFLFYKIYKTVFCIQKHSVFRDASRFYQFKGLCYCCPQPHSMWQSKAAGQGDELQKQACPPHTGDQCWGCRLGTITLHA